MSNLKKVDGRFVIASRASYTPEQREVLTGKKHSANAAGPVTLTPTPLYEKLKLKNRIAQLEIQLAVKAGEESAAPSEKKNKKKKHRQHKKFKNKKKAKKVQKQISTNLTERADKNANLMAEMLKNADDLIKVENSLWIYNEETGCYEFIDETNTAIKLRMLLSDKERRRVSIREYKEAYGQLVISQEIVSDTNFFANKPYVNCLNGVVDVINGKLLEHSPKYRFKHCVNARFFPGAGCERFLQYVDTITAGDKELAELLQVFMGYLMSPYNNAKTAFLLFGVSNTGKSVLCEVLSKVVGDSYVSHADLSQLHKQEYAAVLSGKILNIAPDLTNGALKDVGFFKSLVSHNDTIAARKLYVNPENVRGETKMVFASNHLLSFDRSLDAMDIEAVFNRFLYFPFQNKPITEREDDKSLSQKMIMEEADGIFTWAMAGLKKYVDNGECFPHARLSTKLKEKNMAQYCPEKVFFDKCLVIDDDAVESTAVVKAAYEAYCRKNDIIVGGNIDRYIKKQNIASRKKRISDDGNLLSSGNPRAAYIGIRLKEKYRIK